MTDSNMSSKKVRPLVYDIGIIKKLLNKKHVQLLINSENATTENYLSPINSNDDGSVDSNNTYNMLNKRKINLLALLYDLHAKIKYISSGATGHTFKGEIYKDNEVIYEFALKVSAYPKRENYGDITNIHRPENSEIMMLRVLSYFKVKHETPHLLLPIVAFDTQLKFFLLLSENNLIGGNTDKYDEFVKRCKEGKYENEVSVLFSEWANRGDFLEYVRKQYKHFELIHWRVFFFQILSVLAVIQSKYPSFRHNDMKANNILLQKLRVRSDNPWTYTICGKKYTVPNIGYQIKLWDFDFASIQGVVDNIKVTEEWTSKINITAEKNQYYDIHYFFNTLLRFLPEIKTEPEHINPEVLNFINRVVPMGNKKSEHNYQCGAHIHPKKYRILCNDEYTTPRKLLENDPFFDEFREKI